MDIKLQKASIKHATVIHDMQLEAFKPLLDEGRQCRISPLFILPAYQNKGIAQKVFAIIENMYKPINGWKLDTILEEKGNCYLYEKMGYKKTGTYEKISEKLTIVFYQKEGI